MSLKVFQTAGTLLGYRDRLRRLTKSDGAFDQRLKSILSDGYMGVHILRPIDRGGDVQFTLSDNKQIQFAWAREKGMPRKASLEEILLAQIEDAGSEIFYNVFAPNHQSSFLRRLPGCVKYKVAWHASRFSGVDLGGYDVVLCNFPSILRSFEELGWRAKYFFPSHDPVMDNYASTEARPIDVVFAGVFSRQHTRRVSLLRKIAELDTPMNFVIHLDVSKFTRLAETPMGLFGPLRKYRRPKSIANVAKPSVFGRELYSQFGRSKIVINGAIDMAENDRGNMRCWEAMGCGALLISDVGHYPDGMEDANTMLCYQNEEDAIRLIEAALNDWDSFKQIAAHGNKMIKEKYSKQNSWYTFTKIIESL